MNMKSTPQLPKGFPRILLSLMVIFTLLISTIPFSFAANNYITVSGSSTNVTQITNGTKFTLSIRFNALVPYNKLILVNESTDFAVLESGSSRVELGQVTDGSTHNVTMTYLGAGTNFKFSLETQDGTTVMSSETLYIKGVVPGNPVTPASQFELVTNEVIGDYDTGKTYDVSVSLKNKSTAAAKNVVVILEKNEEALPLTAKDSRVKATMVEVAPDKNEDFKFKLAFSAFAVPKTYGAQLKITYENPAGVKFSEVIPVYLNLQSNTLAPTLGMINTLVEGGPVDAQSPKDLVLTFKNGGSSRAQKITVQLTGFKADGLRLNQDIDTKVMGNMGPDGTGVVRYSILASQLAKGTSELEVLLKYYDDLGVAYERKIPIYIAIANGAPSIKGIVMTFDKNIYPMAANKKQQFTLTVKNTSAETKKDMKLTMTSDATLKFLTPYVQIIDEIKANSSKTFTFEAMLSGTVAANTYPLYATLVPQGGAEGEQSIQVAGVYVTGDAETTSKPKIIIENYNYGGDHVLAGSTFDLSVSFNNTSNVMGIRNAKFVMSADENVFIPVDAASSFFIDKIGPGETVEQIVTLKAKADAKVQMYGITFKIEYEDQNGKSYDEMKVAYTAEEKVSINVKQEVRLEVADIVLAPENYVGTPVPLEVEFFNMGKSPMYNLMVKLEGNFQAQNSNYFVGNFEAGRSDFFSGSIIPEAVGPLEGKLIFAFEDETGTKQEVSFPIASNVIEGSAPGGDGMVNPEIPPDGGIVNPEKPGIDLPLWAWALIVVVPVATGLLVFLRIRKKKRLKALLEVADED